jgi:hypothetical protein
MPTKSTDFLTSFVTPKLYVQLFKVSYLAK